MIRSLLCLALLAMAGGFAQAQPTSEPTSEPTVVYPKVTEFDFRPESVKGGVQSPNGESVTLLGSKRYSSLVRVRADFRKAMLQSAEDI